MGRSPPLNEAQGASDRLEKTANLKHRDQLRRHAPSPPPSEDAKALTPHDLKRRAQNRASQQAFRERKRSQAEGLQQQVQEMQRLHDELWQSYQRQSEEVSQLYERIEGLEQRIQSLKASSTATSMQPLAPAPTFQFEHVALDDPFNQWSPGLFQTPEGWDTQLQ